MKHLLAIALAAATLSAPALAADLPTKAPVNSLFSGYPYVGSGFYFGLNSIAGGGSVQATGLGVNPNSVDSIQGAIGGTVGYSWAGAGGSVFYSVEAMFDWNNFNGNASGIGFTGPAAFEQRVKIGTPLSTVLALLPNFSLPTVAPLPALPAGITASNIHPYLMAGLHEDDVSLNFGLTNASAWRVSPSVGAGMIAQLSNGVALDVWAETVFSQQSVCAGIASGDVCGSSGQKVLAGVGIYW